MILYLARSISALISSYRYTLLNSGLIMTITF